MLYVKVQPANNLSFIVVLSLSKLYMLWCAWTLTFFFVFYLFFLIEYFFSFDFDDEEACDCGHMTCHMI